jgi:micrococcal nuclease
MRQLSKRLLGIGFFILLGFSTLRAVTGERVKVIWVVDGDTVGISYQGRWELVRLLRINTPEKGQPGYAGASEFLRGLVAGKTVTLDFETPGEPERDTYGRLLAYLHLRGDNVNVEIVRAGWSDFWTKYGAGKYAEHFHEAEIEAANALRGLWAIAPKGTPVESVERGWCASRNSRVYHPCSCPSVKTIDPHNLIWFEKEADARASGRRHCRCKR